MKEGNGLRPPKILDQCRKVLQLISVVLGKHLKNEDLREVLLGAENKIKNSTRSIDDESEIEVRKELIKKYSTNKSASALKVFFAQNTARLLMVTSLLIDC